MTTHHHHPHHPHHPHHHLHRPCEVVLRDHRAFWVARCTRCVHQHAGLVHRLVPNTFLLLKFQITIPIHLSIFYNPKHNLELMVDSQYLRLCWNCCSSWFRPTWSISCHDSTPGSVTFMSKIIVAYSVLIVQQNCSTISLIALCGCRRGRSKDFAWVVFL